MITDRIERHGLLLPSLNQQVVERVVVITDDHTGCFGLVLLRLMRFLRVLVNRRRQFPEGYVSSRALNRQIDST